VKPLHPFLIDLARFLPVATGAQLLRHYFAGNVAAFRAALRAAQAKGYIELSTQLGRPWSHTGKPLASFQAGERVLSAEQIAYQASQRWSDSPVPMLIVRGTASLAMLCGGTPRTIASGHLSHELAIAEVFLTKRLHEPTFEWSLVHARPGAGVLPDAIAGTLACEILGRYSGASVQAKLTLEGRFNLLELW